MSQNRRRNNPQDMTVTETIFKIREEMCDKYCKYVYDEEVSQEALDDICEECPMKKL